MIVGIRRLLAAGAVAVSAAVIAPAGAQQTAPPADSAPAPPVVAEPHRLEASAPAVTTRMLAEDALLYLEQLGIGVTPPTTSPPAPAAAAPVAPAPAGENGVSRTITAEAAPAVNGTFRFVFRDVTARTDDAGAALVPMAERRAAVEAYRQGLAKEGAARR